MLPPPCSSPTRSDVQPSSAPRRQYFSSKPAGSSRRSRSSATGTCSSRNLEVVARKNSWSDVSGNGIRLVSAGSVRGPSQRLDLEVLVEAGDAVLAADAAGLVATERQVGAVGGAAVDVHAAG